MPRPSKKNLKKELEREDVIDLTAEEAAAPPIGRKITVEKKVYSRPLTVEESEQAEAVEEEPADDALDEMDNFSADEQSEDMLNFFDADSGDGGRCLRVFQMIKPSAGGKFTKGGNIFRGEIPFTRTFLKDVQENFGGGLFRLQVCGDYINEATGRPRFGIIRSRTVTISAPPMPKISIDDPNFQQAVVSGNYPQMPYFIQPQPTDQPPPKTRKEELKEIVEVVELVDKLRGPREEPAPAAAAVPTDPETAAWQIISKNPDVMERIGSGLAKTILGSKAGDTDPWADVAMEAIRSGQAIGIVREAINAFFSGINGLFPKGNQNGQAPAGPPQAPVPPNQTGFPQATPAVAWNQAPANAEGAGSRPVQESVGADQTNPALQQVVMTPADTLIIQLIQAMERNAPLKEAQSIIEVAIFRNPELGESVDELLNMSIDSIMTLLGAYHPKVSEIPHAKEWLEKLIQSLEGEEK